MKQILFIMTMLCGMGLSVQAQSTLIRGKVMDSRSGEPLSGVTLVNTKNQQVTHSDALGEFQLSTTGTDDQIEASFVGYQKLRVTVGSSSFLTFRLVSEEEVLEEVVVTGYQTERKKDLTGAVSVVKVDEMMSAAENNPIKALQGRVAGMDITSDGNPSGTATIRIRGIGTLNNNDPLFIIDGVPTKGGMHELNSNDIESIQVLKDASSASIYGSRAANGVIIVTTKKGKNGVQKLTFDSYVTQTFYGRKMDVLNTKEYGEAMWQASVNSAVNPNDNNIGYQYIWNYDVNGKPVLNNILVPEYIDANRTMLSSNTDWFDEITRKGLMQSYNLSASNGTDKGSYFLSLGHLHNDGLIKYTDFNRFSTRINTDLKMLNNKLIIGENLSVNQTSELQAPGGILDAALKSLPILPVYTRSGGWAGPTNGMQDRHNPYRLLYDNKDNSYRFWRILGNAYISLEPIKDLVLKTNYGVDYNNFYKRTMTHSYHTGILQSDNTNVSLNENQSLKWTWSNTATYSKSIDRHTINALVGAELFREEVIGFNAYKDGFLVETPEQMWPDMGIGTSIVTGGASGYSLLSYFGNLGYNYDDRYLASFTLRHDGSSRFGSNNRFATFPAFSVGWRMSNEKFLESAKGYLSDLKLRFGWGQTGNQEIGNYVTNTRYVTDYGIGDPTWGGLSGTAYDFYGVGTGQLASGYKQIQRGNPDLKWETTTQTNIGLDFAFLNNSLYGTAEYYIKNTDDILINPPYLGAIGEGGSKWYNGASMQNKGYELSLGYRGKVKDLTFDVSGNISGYNNKVTKLPADVENAYGGNGKGDNILGHPLYSFYGYVADGLFKTQEEVDNHVAQDGKAVGRIRYKNLNTDNVINDDDRTWIGVNNPDFSYGLNINLNYKGFDAIIFFNGVNNIDINTYDVKSQTDFWSVNDTRSNKGRRLLDAWSPENPNSTIPALQAENRNDEGRFSTYFVENGSYLKLRNMQIGYSLSEAFARKIHLQKFRLYVSGQNLFTIKSKNFTGIDPENAAFGYPIPVTYTLGLNVSL